MKNKFLIVFIIICIFSCLGIYGYLVYTNFKYPFSYKTEIVEYSIKYDISCELVASLINCESGFDKSVISSKGAIGLMQIMPKTAQYICEKLGETYSYESLFTPKFNISLGTYYLNYLKQKFDDETVVLCAYNAGEGVVSGWLNNSDYSSDKKTLLHIPYKETREYVKNVQNGKRVYAKKFA